MPMIAYIMAMGNPAGIPVGLAKAMPRRSGKRPLRQSVRKNKPSYGKGKPLPFFGIIMPCKRSTLAKCPKTDCIKYTPSYPYYLLEPEDESEAIAFHCFLDPLQLHGTTNLS